MTLCAHREPAAPIIAALRIHAPYRLRTTFVPTDAADSESSRVARSRSPGPDSLYSRPTSMNTTAPAVATPRVVRTGMPARPSEPRVNVVAFWRNVCTTTSSASVAMAIVDSVIRITPPPKMAATTAATSADSAIAGTSPRFVVASEDGRSGSCADLRISGTVTSAVVYAPMPMNATWPNETMPLLPMNSWIDTTSITFTRNTTYVRLGGGRAVLARRATCRRSAAPRSAPTRPARAAAGSRGSGRSCGRDPLSEEALRAHVQDRDDDQQRRRLRVREQGARQQRLEEDLEGAQEEARRTRRPGGCPGPRSPRR